MVLGEKCPNASMQEFSHRSLRGIVSKGYAGLRWRQVVYAKRYPPIATARTAAALNDPFGYAKCLMAIPSFLSSTCRDPSVSSMILCQLSFVRSTWVFV